MASDTFTRANENPLASPWTKISAASKNSLQLLSNAVEAVDGNDGRKSYVYTGAAVTADQYSQTTVGALGTGGGGGDFADHWQIVRCAMGASDITCYFSTIVHTDEQIGKFVNGTYTKLLDLTGIVSNFQIGDVARLEVEGDALRFYKNGVQQGSTVNDSAIPGAGLGVGINVYWPGLSGSISEWEGGDLTSEATTLNTFSSTAGMGRI